jgi:hypothetical protein
LPRVLPAAWNGPALATFGWLAPLVVAAIAGRMLGRKYLPVAAKAPSVRAHDLAGVDAAS